MKYQFTDQAKSELDDAMAYYESRVLGLGLKLFDDFENTIQRLLEFPESTPLLTQDIQKAVLSHYSFNIIYQIEEGILRILAFMHQKRKPDYWKKRMSK